MRPDGRSMMWRVYPTGAVLALRPTATRNAGPVTMSTPTIPSLSGESSQDDTHKRAQAVDRLFALRNQLENRPLGNRLVSYGLRAGILVTYPTRKDTFASLPAPVPKSVLGKRYTPPSPDRLPNPDNQSRQCLRLRPRGYIFPYPCL